MKQTIPWNEDIGADGILFEKAVSSSQGALWTRCSVAVGAPLMLKPGYMFSSDENSRRTTEAVMSEMISMVTHNTWVTRTHTRATWRLLAITWSFVSPWKSGPCSPEWKYSCCLSLSVLTLIDKAKPLILALPCLVLKVGASRVEWD